MLLTRCLQSEEEEEEERFQQLKKILRQFNQGLLTYLFFFFVFESLQGNESEMEDLFKQLRDTNCDGGLLKPKSSDHRKPPSLIIEHFTDFFFLFFC